jgi:hypothetical protein
MHYDLTIKNSITVSKIMKVKQKEDPYHFIKNNDTHVHI